MRTYSQLSASQKKEANNIALTELLQAILDGFRFDDEKNGDDLQARIDKAIDKADKMQTPWFAHEYIMQVAKEELTAIATADAEMALYPEDERIIFLPWIRPEVVG